MNFASELDDFEDLISAVATWKQIGAGIVKKDYYAMRALRALQSSVGGEFIFKGGTSLAKGWNLIDRYSEDLDLLFVRGEEAEVSKAELNRRMKRAQDVVGAVPDLQLNRRLAAERQGHRDAWYNYPQHPESVDAIGNTIKLEMGIRGGLVEFENREIRSFVAEYARENGNESLAQDLSPFEVRCLDIRLTFVEKLFLVHHVYETNQAVGKMRHYYDLHMLAGKAEIREYVGTDGFDKACNQVRQNTERHFPENSLPPSNSFAPLPAFNPNGDGLKALKRNYAAEHDLFFGEPPGIDEILERLRTVL